MKRRDFIKGSVVLPSVATLGQSMTSTAFAEEKVGKPKVRAYRRLGRTNLQISDISFGAGKLPSAAMV